MTFSFNRAALFIALIFSIQSSISLAVPSPEQWQKINVHLSENTLFQSYKELAESTDKLAKSTAQLCANPAKIKLAQQDFHQSMAAWQGIQHINFGPIEFLMRNFSMEFWPDPKNLTSKQLNRLLHDKNPESLSTEYFRSASVAVKGFPALERLLFSDKATTAFGCKLTTAIAQNVATMSRDTFAQWQSMQLPRINAALSGDDFYEDSTEAATELMKSLVEPLEVIRDQKLVRPLKSSAKKAKPRLLESWRSRRSLENIQINLASLESIYLGENNTSVQALIIEAGQPKLAAEIAQDFIRIQAEFKAIDKPLYETLKDPKTHAKLMQLSEQINVLAHSLKKAMKLLNIQLGFNSRDGD